MLGCVFGWLAAVHGATSGGAEPAAGALDPDGAERGAGAARLDLIAGRALLGPTQGAGAQPPGRRPCPQPGRRGRGDRRRAPADRARPARRPAAAAGVAGDEPRHGPGTTSTDALAAGAGGDRVGPRRGARRAHRAAPVRPRAAPGGAQRPRARRRAVRRRRAGAVPVRLSVDMPVRCSPTRRGGRLLRGVRGAHQRGQARPGDPGRRHRRADRRSALLSRSSTTARGGARIDGRATPAARPAEGLVGLAGGTGLRGLSRRAAAVDGTLAIHSPHGGPTAITVVLPCES